MTPERLHPKRVHVEILVRGRVQGVAYRAGARDTATRLGLDGTVENLASGDVRVVAEGDYDAVQELVSWCQTGPALADVEAIHTVDGPLVGLRGFNIL